MEYMWNGGPYSAAPLAYTPELDRMSSGLTTIMVDPYCADFDFKTIALKST